ncbi:ribose ABC transporter [Chromatiales bacterium (ex Bugula neritina AB1)]|nr:ribose ABC transporter [Chromatiales bacterium (ex Bugula neritina AB1)]
MTPEIPFRLKVLKLLTTAWSWLFLFLIIGFFEVWSWNVYDRTFFGNLYNLQSVLLTATQILMMALGLTLIIIAAGIDLSIGFIAGLAAVTMAVVIRALPDMHPGLSFALGISAGIGISLIPGMINGWLIARLNVPSFIGTLGMFGVTRGVAFLIAGGATVSIRNSVARDFGNGKLFDVIPIPVAVAVAVTLAFHYLLAHTRFGLYVYAMGGNMQSAIRAGVNTTRITFSIFMLSAFTAGLAGIFYTARFSAGAADAGEPILLNAVAAVFIGGASLTGGSGTISGTVIGSLIIAIIQFGLVFIGMPPFWQFITVGLVIIIAVLIDQSRDKIARATMGAS